MARTKGSFRPDIETHLALLLMCRDVSRADAIRIAYADLEMSPREVSNCTVGRSIDRIRKHFREEQGLGEWDLAKRLRLDDLMDAVELAEAVKLKKVLPLYGAVPVDPEKPDALLRGLRGTTIVSVPSGELLVRD